MCIRDSPRGVGEGRSKQEAAQQAAAMALHLAGLEASEYTPNLELERHYGFAPPAEDDQI